MSRDKDKVRIRVQRLEERPEQRPPQGGSPLTRIWLPASRGELLRPLVERRFSAASPSPIEDAPPPKHPSPPSAPRSEQENLPRSERAPRAGSPAE